MAVEFTRSASKHGISPEDAIYAIANAEASAPIKGRDGNKDATVFVGHPHAQTDRYIEVIVEITPPRNLKIFHVMELTDKFRHLIR